jgi:hypothetical protein
VVCVWCVCVCVCCVLCVVCYYSAQTPKSGLSLNMAALQATIQVQKSSERKGDRSKEKNGPRPQSPRCLLGNLFIFLHART